MILVNNHNFIASAEIKAHNLLTIDTTNSTAQKLCVKPAGSSDPVVGVASCDAAAGDAVNVVKIEVGQVFMAIAASSFSAGAQLAASSGKVAGSGALPLFAIDAATAANQPVRVICGVHPDANT